MLLRRKILFVFSLCLLFYGVGTVTAWNQVFPFTVVRDAAAAAKAYIQVYSPFTEEGFVDPDYSEPTVRRTSPQTSERRILVAGGVDCLAHLTKTGHALAWIMDHQGAIEHVWEYDPKMWDGMNHVEVATMKTECYPTGLHLYDDGSLLVSFQATNCWPYAVGMAKFDKDSRVLWKQDRLAHHWFAVGEDGRIYTPTMRIIDAPYRVGDTVAEFNPESRRMIEDFVTILDSDGHVLDEISMLDALVDSGCVGLFQGAIDEDVNVATSDPTHLNDVRLVTPELAQGNPLLKAGDLLVSLRNINAVAILDPATRRFKWISAGSTVRQHCPRLVGDEIWMFDNRGGSLDAGGSRITAVDMESHLPRQVFPTAAKPKFEHPFLTGIAGHFDLDGHGRALVSLTLQGEIWEVDLETGEVLWEYVYVHPENRHRSRIFTAEYVADTPFPLNRIAKASP